MILFKKAFIFLQALWYGYVLVKKIKYPDVDIHSFLHSLGNVRDPRKGLTPGQIGDIILSASRFFYFHRQQQCMCRSLSAYTILKQYGYRPYLVIDINFVEPVFHNCHCWISLDSNQVKEVFGPEIISIRGNLILLDKSHNKTGVTHGKHHTDRLLQSKLPLLFCEENDGRRQ